MVEGNGRKPIARVPRAVRSNFIVIFSMKLVTAYYNIDSKHDLVFYTDTLKNFIELRVDDNVEKVLYTNKTTYDLISDIAGIDKLTVRQLELTELPFYKYLDVYKKHRDRDYNRQHSELLYLLWNSKPHFVARELSSCADQAHTYWFDVSLVRQGTGDTIKILNHDNSNENGITILRVGNGYVDERGIPRYGSPVLGGGCFGGTAVSWYKFIECWKDIHDYYLSIDEFIGQDQRLLTTLSLKHPELCNIIYPKTYVLYVDGKVINGNPWFYMVEYLSQKPGGIPRFLFQEEYTVIKGGFKPNASVTVIIPTYNRYSQLLEAITSVREQSLKNIELIVVDDGSTDDRYRFLASNTNIDVLLRLQNCRSKFGAVFPGGRARNYGMMLAHGKYIAILDDDDTWIDPNKLNKQMDIMSTSNIMMSCTNAIKDTRYHDMVPFFPERISEIKSNPMYIRALTELLGDNMPIIITERHMLCINLVIASSVMLHRKVIEEVGYFRFITDSEDYDLWLRIAQRYPIAYLSDFTVKYDSTSASSYNKNPWAFKYMCRNIGSLHSCGDEKNFVYVYPDEIITL